MGTNDTAAGEETWQDITEEFLTSTKHLELGELLSCDRFTLLEAMSAIELMDPRMDSTMMLINCNRRIMNFDKSIKSGSVRISDLDLVEIIGIMDDSYSCLTSWLDGYHLAQTVMINLYLQEPERIQDRCLRAFSQAMLKIVDFIESIVLAIPCFEEEDFYTHHDKFNLGNQFSDLKVLNLIEDVTHQYEKMLTDDSNQSQSNNKQSTDDASPEPKQERNHLSAIINRLKFTSNLYSCLYNLARCIARDLPSNIQSPQYQKYLKLVQNTVSNCDQNLERCLDFIDKWMDSIHLGVSPERTSSSKTGGGEFPTIMGFEPLLHYKLLPPGYPRCPTIRDRPSTVDYIKNLVMKMRLCLSASTNFNQRSLKLSLESIEQLSRHSKPSSCVVSRSIVQTLYLSNRSMHLLKDDVNQSISDFCDPVIQSIRKDEADSSILDNLVYQSTQVYSRIVNLYGHNPARQHEKLPDIILSFKNLRFTALSLNRDNYNRIVHQWVMIQYNNLMTKYVLMGFELELYSCHEYPYIFWYLHDILCLEERFALEFALRSISEYQREENENSKKTKGKKPRKKYQNQIGTFERNLMINDAFRLMTGGFFMLTHGLKLDGKIPTPPMKYTSEKIWYDHRFETISPISQFDMYEDRVEKLKKLDEIYAEAARYFGSACQLYTRLGGYESFTKICKTNMVVARILGTNLLTTVDRRVTFNFETNPHFPIVKV